MQPFTTLCDVAAPLDGANIDTDQIIPARFLRKPRAAGYGNFLFHDLRYDDAGRERPEFALNLPAFRSAKILVGDANFGCGSSREGAVYALLDFGIRAVIAPSFGDIFRTNCVKNSVLPLALDGDAVTALRSQLRAVPGSTLAIDLERQCVTRSDGSELRFEIDPFAKECLLLGLDDIELTLRYSEDIARFESQHRATYPWWFRRAPGAHQ